MNTDEQANDDWEKPCRDCVFRSSDEGCALGCSLLLIWTDKRVRAGRKI